MHDDRRSPRTRPGLGAIPVVLGFALLLGAGPSHASRVPDPLARAQALLQGQRYHEADSLIGWLGAHPPEPRRDRIPVALELELLRCESHAEGPGYCGHAWQVRADSMAAAVLAQPERHWRERARACMARAVIAARGVPDTSSVRWADRALAIVRAAPERDAEMEARALIARADVRISREEGSPGAADAREAANLLVAAGRDSGAVRFERLRTLGMALGWAGHYDSTFTVLDSALAMVPGVIPESSPWPWFIRQRLAAAWAYAHRPDKAQAMREIAYEGMVRTCGGSDERTIWAARNYFTGLSGSGRLAEAESLLIAWRDRLEEDPANEGMDVRMLDVSRARLLAGTGRRVEALRIDEAALREVDRGRPIRPGQRLTLLGDLAAFSDVRRSLEYGQRYAQAIREYASPRWLDWAICQANIGECYGQLGELEQARAHLDSAYARLVGDFGEEILYAHDVRRDLINLAIAAGDSTRLDSLLSDFRRRQDRSPDQDLIANLGPRGCIVHSLVWLGRSNEALAAALTLARQETEFIQETAPGLDDRSAREFTTVFRGGLDFLFSALTDLGRPSAADRGAALEALVTQRGLLLESAMARLRLSRLGPAEGGEAPDTLRAEVAHRLVSGFQRSGDARTASELDSLRAAMSGRQAGSGVRAELRDAPMEPVLAALRDRVGPVVSYVQFLRVVRSHTPHLMYAPGVPWYGAFVRVPGDPVPEWLDLGPASRVDSLVAAWRERLDAPGTSLAELRGAGEALRAAVWDPVARGLPGVTDVTIVPDGALQRVNFAALPREAGGWLLEDARALHVVEREADLLEPARESRASSGLLALGGPDFDEGPVAVAAVPAHRMRDVPPCEGFTNARFTTLPAASDEVHEVAGLWERFAAPRSLGEAVVRSGREATAEALLREAPGKRVVHVATHMFALDPECQPDSARAQLVRDNPLSFCGLVLAGANRPRVDRRSWANDGLLTAEEIVGLDLRGTDCVVLSGCDSGLGTPEAMQGVYGLRRAFRLAGARTLVVTLGRVDDEASRYWMRAFYRARYVEGRTASAAGREASRALRDRERAAGRADDPRAWAPFLVIEG
jgi:CHAT domain-containing protein/tetratricopeptide (TPR) repeat protein